jgi:hypothetical protein
VYLDAPQPEVQWVVSSLQPSWAKANARICQAEPVVLAPHLHTHGEAIQRNQPQTAGQGGNRNGVLQLNEERAEEVRLTCIQLHREYNAAYLT